jgi:CRP/FNR family transcriptional regulator, anaerobic regulatory protein
MSCVACPNRERGICGALNSDLVEHVHPFERLNMRRSRIAQLGESLAHRGETSSDVFLLCSGWAFRYILLSNGRRQILQFLLPGDLFSVVNVFESQFQSSVMALTDVQISCFERSEIRNRCTSSRALQAAIEDSCKEEHAVANELIAVLGLRSAPERVAYLLLHLTRRLKVRSVIREDRYRFPLRQRDIAEAVGLTPVHVNRVLGSFRDRGVCLLSDGVLTVLQPRELERIGALN